MVRWPKARTSPAKGAADTADFVGDHCLSVPRTAEHDPAVAFPTGHRFGRRADELGIIDRIGTVRPEIMNFVSQVGEKLSDPFLVIETRVIGGEGDFHALSNRTWSKPAPPVEITPPDPIGKEWPAKRRERTRKRKETNAGNQDCDRKNRQTKAEAGPAPARNRNGQARSRVWLYFPFRR
jgi:hypothetical protein